MSVAPLRRRSVLLAVGMGGGALLGGCAVLRPRPAAVVPGANGPRLATADAPVYYVLQVDARGFPAEILLNDVPVERLDADNLSQATAQVNMWVAPGRNSLRVRGQLQRPAEHESPTLTVQLRRQSAGADGTAGAEVVVRIDVRPGDPFAPFDERREFVADPAPPSQLFQVARPGKLDDSARAGVTKAALELEQALSRRDPDIASAILSWKAIDIARAQYLPPEDARLNQRETLASVLEDPEFAIDPLPADPGRLSFDHLAGGRLIRVSRQGLPAIQARLSQGGRFVLSLYAANVEGRWRVVR
jgi:hypothetical protein